MDLSLAETQSRFAPPPWTTDSPAWQSLDRQLAADHRARWINTFVNDLDLSELEAVYRGSGSQAYRPDLMLKIALFETLEGHLSPAAWARHQGTQASQSFARSRPAGWDRPTRRSANCGPNGLRRDTRRQVVQS